MAEHDDSTATILFELGANAVIALAKGVVAWITGSTSMVGRSRALGCRLRQSDEKINDWFNTLVFV
jgi:hypothetical protein